MHDTESGLYYLQSRYYDPKVGRFLHADALVSTGQGILGNNMFAYCLNSPVQYSDSSGNFARTANPNANCFDAHSPSGGGGGSIIVPGYLFEELVSRLSDAFAVKKTVVKEEEEVNVYIDAKTDRRKQHQYWEAARIGNNVVLGDGLTFVEASVRVAVGFDVMCANHDAAKWIVIVNGYWNAVGPEIHGDAGYFWHYHPNRRSHTHIWYYGG